MECAEILMLARTGIDAVIEPDRADGKFIAETGADPVAHVAETGIVCIGAQVAGIDKNSALQFTVGGRFAVLRSNAGRPGCGERTRRLSVRRCRSGPYC